MKRLGVLIALLATVFGASAAAGTGVASGGEAERYRAYSLLRDRLHSCSLDRQWRHLSATARKSCRRLRRRYVLYSVNGESSQFFYRCLRRARRCPPAPTGVRSPRARIPRGATVFR